MKFKIKKYVLLTLLGMVLVGVSCEKDLQQYDITVESLLREMIDRDVLAKLDSVPYKLLQVSSYSKKAVSSDQPGWFDNGDSHVFPMDSTGASNEHVIMDVDGPGAIVRIWSAWNPQPETFSDGTLRIYFDYAETPQIEGNIGEVISSNTYLGAPLSERASLFLENEKWYSGHNLYFPLTFAKHIKITYQKGDERVRDAVYYKIDYRKYDDNVTVRSYQKGDLEQGVHKDLVAKVKTDLVNAQPDLGKLGIINMTGEVKVGNSLSTTLEGSKAIKKLVVKLKAENLEQALRSTVLEMEFDGKKTVWTPIGDFFGTGYKIAPYQSRYSAVRKDGEMISYFPMPFQNLAKITVHNLGEQSVELTKFDIHSDPWQWDGRSLYFHSNWRIYSDIKTNKKQDINYINISGKGKHVGDVLTLFNNSYYWWGEGDDKIYVDGETFPSHFGTGTEDYYGYAWCSVVDFHTPFNAQPTGDGNRSPGMTVNSRWRTLDAVPFNTSYRFDMELWHWDERTKMDYSPTVFWYGTKESKAEVREDIEGVKLPVKHAERFEGESFKVKRITGGETLVEAFLSYDWSGRNHLFWKNIKKGDELETVFYSEKERKGILEVIFTHAPKYVVADVYLNDEPIFENLDLYGDKVSLKSYTFKDGLIKKGDNVFKLVVKGSNPKIREANELGFDYLRIEMK
ncbi:glycoside hydrolase family 172 protein [Flagellimonas sp.]|uniref:glycoside hydrolase family 172 protein n=1 Tax=Flagellimonas sp. TaxID=2058762 RepID=UPI003BB14281